MTTGRINQVAIRSKRGCCGTTGAPRFFSHVLRVHRYSNTTLAACTSSENRQFRTLPGDSSAILAPRHADSLPLDPTDRSKTPAKHGRPREQHYICPSCPTPTEIDSASIRTRARIRSHDCLLPHSSHRILHRHGTPERPRDRASSRPDLEFGEGAWPLAVAAEPRPGRAPLATRTVQTSTARQKLFRGRKIRARSREYARPGRLDSNIFWSGWEKFSESKNTDPRVMLSRVRKIRASTPPFEQEGQPTRESHLSDSRKVGSRHCQRPNGRLTLPVEDGARVHRRFLGGILT
ncbi:unnamed protein product [Clavelina lepadiformis]|uniref:Uncharacterized protein n=1 Tax=Clavelina lepadiformis TaxID=159417 RepID=A0ABP0H424_CLALP